MAKKYMCPVCKTALSKNKYEKALGILHTKERHLKTQLQKMKDEKKRAKLEGVQSERNRNARILRGKDRAIEKLKNQLRNVKEGTTPQTDGLAFEGTLTSRLKREFPSDLIEHKGKSGDILHQVSYGGKDIGSIIYECKRTPKILTAHIRQAYIAKEQRGADFAVLVTTGRKKNFSGFSIVNNVLVVSPLAVLSIASLLRENLIEMAKANVAKEKRHIVAQKILGFIKSPQFKNPLEQIIRSSTLLRSDLQKEIKDHMKQWSKRWETYHKIQWDAKLIQENLSLIQIGRATKATLKPPTQKLEMILKK